MTDTAHYAFTVKERSGGPPWIAWEPSGEQIPILRDAILGFNLRGERSIERAREVSRFLNANIDSVSCTMFDGLEPFVDRS
jgi:hypothetical protein